MNIKKITDWIGEGLVLLLNWSLDRAFGFFVIVVIVGAPYALWVTVHR